MSVPSIRVNNYVGKDKYSFEVLTKMYIIFGWLIGTNRLSVIWDRSFKIAGFCYTLVFNCLLLYFIVINTNGDMMIVLNVMQYYFCLLCAIVCSKTLQSFYYEMFKVDQEIKLNYSLSLNCKVNFIQCVCLILYTVMYNTVLNIIEGVVYLSPDLMFVLTNYILECHYYGHLFGLLQTRISSIRILLSYSYPINNNEIHCPVEKEFVIYKTGNVELQNEKFIMDIRKLMHLYYAIVKAYDFLNAAIRWQLLVIVVTTFLTDLNLSYYTVLNVKENKYNWRILIHEIGIIVAVVLPMVAPCVFGQRLQNEVQLLQNSLYTRIHKNGFDKTTRSVANYFLALTEARSLTFSLFRMFEINLSLFFKSLKLLISYVVIILQFQKVLNDDTSNVKN
nr:gustatory receptor 17 [Papilio glaucus]